MCNARAEVMLMSVSEARYCGENFEHLKIQFHPSVAYDEFIKMDETRRAKISVEAYRHYSGWLNSNPTIVLRLRDASTVMLSARSN
jgi:hypothetical protein